jgi:hypothetical protein
VPKPLPQTVFSRELENPHRSMQPTPQKSQITAEQQKCKD